MCGAAADATRRVGQNSSQYKRHLLQQIIFAKPIGSPQRITPADHPSDFDLWTSPNRLAIIAVFAHFIDKFGNQQSRLLALRRQLGIHSGENLAETLFEIVQLWDIRGQVGTVISDNVTTNDTCLSCFYRQLDPSIRPADIKAHRMRCYGHVLNLVARAFLFGKDAESFELESDINGMRGLQEQDLRHWRSKGPIGKLHNIVKFIRSSPQRSEYFKRIAHEQEAVIMEANASFATSAVLLVWQTCLNSPLTSYTMATISSYFGAASGRRPDSDRVILAPTYISPRPNDLDGILIEPDEFKLNGKQYVRYVVVAKSQKHTKKRTSVVWQYGEDIQLKQDLTKRFWYCYLCEQQQRQQGLPISGKGNCTALDHLESKHQIDRETGERRHAKRHLSQPSIVDFNNISTLVFKRRFDEFKELLIRWIVYCHIAFFQIENLYFRELLFYIFPGLTTLLPKARLVIRRWIIDAFEARKDSLRQEMQTAHSNISISFDIWTSPNYQAILGCVAHFINRSGKRRTVVLALRELVGEHSGENMADVLLHIFDDYGISGRIGYFMADNASSNDACIDLVLKALYQNMSRKHRVRRRLRCFGHIVNLCAQAFIMGKDASKTCKDLDSAYREGDYTRIRELWKKRGAIGRLHNIVRYIRASPQRRQFFRSIQIGGDLAAFDGLELVQSQSTRWNSYFLSIGRALNVKERIQLFCDQYEPPQSDRDVLDQRLSPRQWDELGHLHDQLETFYEATVMNEGRQWTLADHFQSLDWLMDEIHLARRKFEQLAEDALRKRGPNRQDKHDEFDDYNWLAAAAEVAWQKCEKYYNKADESPAYYAAISLNPSLKNQWYYQVWNGSDDKRAWIQAAVGAVKELWVDEYKGKFAHGAPVPTHVFKSPEPKEKSFTSVRNHKRLKLRHFDPHSSPELPSTDHYNEFITTDVIGLNDDEEFDPIQYWNDRYHSQTDLARMALDVLALPPMSDECERLFSSAKLLLTDRRSRLRMDVIEASECLRAWYGRPEQKAFDDRAIGLMGGEVGSTVGADGPGAGEGEEGGEDDGREK
ncbi:transposase-like protein [Fusarium oxysporum f. sp. phaseoli]